jgi:HD-like signal output (HDOD) protein
VSTLLIASVVLVAAIAAVAGWWLGRRTPPDAGPQTAPVPAPASAPPPSAAVPAPTPPAAPPATAAAPLPTALRAFRPVMHERLPAAQIDALVQRLAQIPPPPLALHKLVSAEFLEAARPSALAETIMAEAQIAARLLATVNSPKYGLRKPVASVVQAVSLLGLNTVRNLCLQHLLHNSFGAAGAAQRQRLDRLLNASTTASELCARLATALGLPEPGALATQCVLGFLGPLAATVLLTPGSPAWGPHASLLQRLDAEQQALGLGAGEIGALLMAAWGLPAPIVAAVRDLDRPLHTPVHLVDPRQAPGLALCYLATRLGERAAQGQAVDVAALLVGTADDLDTCHLAGYLALPALAGLGAQLQGPAVQALLQPPATATVAA